MRLSESTVLGLIYGASIIAAQTYVVVSAPEAGSRLGLDRRAVLRAIGWSLVFTIPVAIAILAVDRLLQAVGLTTNPAHGLDLNVAGLLAAAWGLTASSILVGTGAKRIRATCGIDVVRRAGTRTAVIGGAIGLIATGCYIFGGHILRVGLG